jgi:uncharacterized protein (DUF1697 family)
VNTYVAFLRGINVSGQKIIKMPDLRASLEGAGLVEVQSYIQSGNILFKSKISSIEKLGSVLKNAIKEDFGFDVPTIIKTPDALTEILERNPYIKVAERKNLYFTLLNKTPEKYLLQKFNYLKFENEDFHLTDGCLYLNCKKGAGKAKLNNNLVEKKLKVTATTRNFNTMSKMIDLAQV